MLTAEMNISIDPTYSPNLGFHAIYDRTHESKIAEGVVIAHIGVANAISLFQLSDVCDLFNIYKMQVLAGSCFFYKEKEPYYVKEFPIKECRLPTHEELKWYNQLDTI